jgi:beta-xylosidase
MSAIRAALTRSVWLLVVVSSLTVLGATTSAATARPKGAGAVAPVRIHDPAVLITPSSDVANPFIVKVGGLYLMFASQGTLYIPITLLISTSLTRWGTTILDPLPKLPSWAQPGFTWSPDVRRLDGRYVMWFSAGVAGTTPNNPTKCIGVATAAWVTGPYVSRAKVPFVCQRKHFGSIDPRTFVDPEHRLWLLWKSDDNADPRASPHTTIYTQRLSSDGLRLRGKPIALLRANLPWERGIVEAPQMVFAGGRYWLFFSGDWFNQPKYAIGVARCAGPTGPCKPSSHGPWLASNAQGSGPGEETLFYDGSRWWMLYSPYAVKYETPTPRPAALARLTFGEDGPAVLDPGTAAWSASDPRRPRQPGAPRPVCSIRLVPQTCGDRS